VPEHAAANLPSIESVMTATPWYIQVTDTLKHAREVMESNHIRHLPVKEGDALVGLVSHRDVAFLLEGSSPKRRARLRVRDACALNPYIVDASEPLAAVLLVLAERQIGSALVTRGGELAGILTATDACRAFGLLLRSLAPPRGGHDLGRARDCGDC
jgi:acetoin utilization protein AcuB